MYKSQYDDDVTLWSPAGRLHQLEYACAAVDQGSVVIALRSNKHAVLVGLQRAPSDLAQPQEKLFKVDDHMGIGVSGLIADGRRLCKYMRRETLNYKYIFNKPMPLSRLVVDLADKHQQQTQISSGRPYGVGLLVVGYDDQGPHVYETDPTGNYFEYYGHAIGARNQAAKTYLEKKFDKFPNASLKELIQDGVQALKETVRTKDIKLTTSNTAVMVVGEDTKLWSLQDNELQPYIDNVEGNEDNVVPSSNDQQQPPSSQSQPMDIDENV